MRKSRAVKTLCIVVNRRRWLCAAFAAVIWGGPAWANISSCTSADGMSGCTSIDQDFGSAGALIGTDFIVVGDTSASFKYVFSGTVNGPAGPGTISGTFTTNAAGTSVSSFSFNLSKANLPFSVNDAGGYILDNNDGYLNVFGAGWFQFQNLGFSHQVVLNLLFNSLPGSTSATQSSLLQAPNVAGANWDYIGTVTTGQAVAPEPTNSLLLGAGLAMLVFLRRATGPRRGSANLKIADEQSSDHPSGR
jgi:hypothetical protein